MYFKSYKSCITHLSFKSMSDEFCPSPWHKYLREREKIYQKYCTVTKNEPQTFTYSSHSPFFPISLELEGCVSLKNQIHLTNIVLKSISKLGVFYCLNL